jgi:hypothetical protein
MNGGDQYEEGYFKYFVFNFKYYFIELLALEMEDDDERRNIW